MPAAPFPALPFPALPFPALPFGPCSRRDFRSTLSPASPEVGRWLASFLYEYRVQMLGDTAAHPDLCLVYDVRNDEYYEAGKSTKKLFKNIESACVIIRSLWEVV